MPNLALQDALSTSFGTDKVSVLKDPFDTEKGAMLKIVKNEATGLYYFFFANSIGDIRQKLIGYQAELDHIINRALTKHPRPFFPTSYHKGGKARHENTSAKEYIIAQIRWGTDPDAFLPFTEPQKTPA